MEPDTHTHTDVALDGGVWGEGDDFESICTIAPTHEPWGKKGKRTKK
jgi:hypothetical protein